jgi:hypothetical protein
MLCGQNQSERMSRERLSTFADLEYFDGSKVVREALRQGFSHGKGSSPAIPRGHSNNELIEHLDAAVFAHGLAELTKLPVHIARHETQDHDFVLRFVCDDSPYYCPLQLKEIVPAEVNAKQDPTRLLDSLSKYSDSADLEVAIKVGREGFDPRSISPPSLRVAGLWFFGQLTPDPSRWYLYGNCIESPAWFEFVLPS